MKTKWIQIGMIASLAGLAFVTRMAADQPVNSTHPLRHFMREKLACSTKVLEGITLEDYKLVETNCVKMWAMTKTDPWRRFNFEGYAEKTGVFQKAAGELAEAARNKDTEAILKAYDKVTRSCVDCHDHFRSQQEVRHQYGVEMKPPVAIK